MTTPTPTAPTTQQLQRMLRLHRQMEAAYRQYGATDKAEQAARLAALVEAQIEAAS